MESWEQKYQKLEERLTLLTPSVFLDGVSISSTSGSSGTTPFNFWYSTKMQMDTPNWFSMRIDGGQAGTFDRETPLTATKKENFRSSNVTPSTFGSWQQVVPCVGSFTPSFIHIRETVISLFGSADYQLFVINRSGIDLNLFENEFKVFRSLDPGMYWLLLTATTTNNLPLKVFIPIIIGDWDGLFENERSQRTLAYERWASDWDKKKSSSRLIHSLQGHSRDLPPENVSDVLRCLHPTNEVWRPMHLQVEARIKQDLQERGRRLRAFQEAQDRVNLRISANQLPLPRVAKNADDFELLVSQWMIAWGHDDAMKSQRVGDSGIDVSGEHFVAQVKFFADSPVGRPDVQNLKGAASVFTDVWVLFFAFANGYTREATEWATSTNIALFAFNVDTLTFDAVNSTAESFIEIHGSYQ